MRISAETASVYTDVSSLSRLPSYRSRRTTRASNQEFRPPSYITNTDDENDRDTITGVESDDLDEDDQPTPRHSPRPPTYITDVLSVDQLDLSSEETHIPDPETTDAPQEVVEQVNAQANGVQRVEETQSLASSAESLTLQPVRRQPLQQNVTIQPDEQALVIAPPPRTTNALGRGLQRARTARNGVTNSVAALVRSATAPAPGTTERILVPIQFPSVYIIRQTLMEPLVTTSLLRDHLSLLGVFYRVKREVENMDELRTQPGLSCLVDAETRWSWFAGFAVERFAAWSEALKTDDLNRTLEELVPPVDVLMVWHTYLLNPGWHAEDCYRIPSLGILGRIGQLVFAPHLLHALGTILCEPTTSLRRETWELKTQGRPFDLFEDAKRNQPKLIWCPDCQEPVLHPYMNDEGTGYLQQNFWATCSNDPCYFNTHKIVKTTLGARKLAEDLVRPDDNTHRSYIAGTFWAAGGLDDGSQARKLKKKILKFEDFQRPLRLADEELLPMLLKRHRNDPLRQNRLTGRDDRINEGWVLSILYRHGFMLHQIIDGLALWLRASGYDPEAMSRRIYTAYTDGNLFSVDLRGSVLRESSFLEQLDKIGWLAPGFFHRRECEVLLQYAIVRYHGFLDLMSCNVTLLLVPTLDIDLAWHTHQLSGPKYHSSCMTYISRFVDHNDKVEENRLSDAYEDTCRAWRARFDASYVSCGCPSAKAMGDYVNNYLGLSGFRTESSSFYEGNLQLPPFKALSTIASTHPSDHDAVYNNRQLEKSEILRATRLEKRNKKLNHDGNLLKGFGFKKEKRPERTSEDHECPFSHPIPPWYTKSDKTSDVGYAAHMVDSQPLGEIADVPPEMKKYSDSTCVALHILK